MSRDQKLEPTWKTTDISAAFCNSDIILIESFLWGLDQISFLAILAKDMGLALLFTMHYWRWLFINLNQVLWCCFAGAFQAWYAHGDRHSHPLQPGQSCLPSEAWIHTGKETTCFSDTSYMCLKIYLIGGASERSGPEIWTVAGCGVLPKDALILIFSSLPYQSNRTDHFVDKD